MVGQFPIANGFSVVEKYGLGNSKQGTERSIAICLEEYCGLRKISVNYDELLVSRHNLEIIVYFALQIVDFYKLG